MAGLGINPYKFVYAVIITVALDFLLASFSAQDASWILTLFLISYAIAHVTFVTFKKMVFRKVVVFDMGGVLVTGDFFTENIKTSKEMVRLLTQLRQKYVTALLSDNNALFSYGARTIMPISAMFDIEYYSSMAGVRKTDVKSFQTFAAKHGYSPSDLIMIDDAEGNIANARKAGWCGIVFNVNKDSPAKLKQALADYGVTF
ncbi:MAG: HAD-IA family hydrolase [Candidatus Micrarchaeota archaeon]